MKFRFHSIAAVLSAALVTACFGVDDQLGEAYIATNQKYDIYTAEFDIDDIEMQLADSLSGYSMYRFSVGALRDPVFGLTTRSAAFTLVPVNDELDFGKNATFKSFHFTAPYDSVSCDNLSQAHILQNIHVYALEKELKMDTSLPDLEHSAERITQGIPVYNGTDSLSLYFNKAFGERYMQITQADLDDIETYRKNFPGIFITTDAPAGNGGRINMFKVPIDVENGSIYGSYAILKFKADYGTRTQVDTSFLFYIGPYEKYDLSTVTSTNVNNTTQLAFNLTTHESQGMEGKASDIIWFEGGRGLKPVVKAQSLKDKLTALVSVNGDPDQVVVSKATIELPFEFPEDYEDMRLYPTTLSPTSRIVDEDGVVTFAGITDASVSTENQGNVNRSKLVYAPDLSHHIQSLLRLKDLDKIENYDIWFLAMADEVIISSNANSSNSEMADLYQQMAYMSYYNDMYSGYGGYGGYGYGGYGYGGYGYGSNYYNYYNYMMLANMYNSANAATASTQTMMDFHRFYRAALNGPASAERKPRLKVTYAVPSSE
ncbi:MAG: hypothetical protein J6S66_04245 [Bacteroidales bacterium]|nr:hypothetical protein [Bacteroidales bacterium]